MRSISHDSPVPGMTGSPLNPAAVCVCVCVCVCLCEQVQLTCAATHHDKVTKEISGKDLLEAVIIL